MLLTERLNNVLVLTLNRPSRRNAVDRALSLALADAMDRLDGDPTLSAAVLTGAGGHFSAGMDLEAFGRGESIELDDRGIGGLTRYGPRKPIIAAIEGFALAGGFEMAVACDIVVASESAKFGLPEAKRGLMAGSGGLIRIARSVPYSVAAEWALTARLIDANEVHHWGLVSRLVPEGKALESALELAEKLGENSPFALSMTKELLRAATETSDRHAWRVQDELLERVFASADAKEGAAAFVEKRAPRWEGA